MFMHISAVERSGMHGLAEGQKISYELQADRRTARSPRPTWRDPIDVDQGPP